MSKTLDEILEEQMGAAQVEITGPTREVTFHEMEAFARKMHEDREGWKDAATIWQGAAADWQRHMNSWKTLALSYERSNRWLRRAFWIVFAGAFSLLGALLYLIYTR